MNGNLAHSIAEAARRGCGYPATLRHSPITAFGHATGELDVTLCETSLNFFTRSAIGLMGAMACLIVLLGWAPPPASLAEYALFRGAMGAIATWIFFPSLGLMLIAGLLGAGVRLANDRRPSLARSPRE